MLANVVDFSQAERNGFILAFIDFWQRREPDGRTVAELREIAPTLLKGCEQHFRKQITRVKKISGVVDPSQTDVFENYAKRLLKCNSVEEFTSNANEFIGTFPKAETWIRWWMLPEHALVAFAEYYRLQFEAQRHGIRTQYGADREPWKTTGNLHGRTHFSRTPGARRTGAKKDGRLPDTGKALLGRLNLKPKAPEFEKGYKWKDNSCWLDSSLTAIVSAASRDFDKSMDPIFSALPQGHPLSLLLQMIHTRHSLELAGYEEGGYSGWLYHLANVPPRKDSAPAALSAQFPIFASPLYYSEAALGWWREQVQLTDALCHEYNGDMRKWFLDSIRPSKPRPALSCWRAHDGDIFCDGDALSYEVILSIPIVLIIEISVTSNGRYWNIPKGLAVYANNPTAVARKVYYSIASHLYSDTQQNHFIARYSGPTDLLPGIPTGYHLHAVVYHLNGGQPAQNYFRQEQIRLAGIKPGLHFGTNSTKTGIPVSCELWRPNLEIVSDKDRSLWVPTVSSAIDYIIPQKSPRKSQASVPRIHRQRSIMSISSSDENSWHPPMAPISMSASSSSDSDTESRHEQSLPPITTISPSSLQKNSGLTLYNVTDAVHGHMSNVSDPLHMLPRISMWNPSAAGMIRGLFSFFPGFIRMLPAIQNWLNDTVWMPAAFIDFNPSRPGREYQFEWIPMDPSNPVIQSYQDCFADGPFDTRESMTWMHLGSRLCLLQLLAIQHSLGIPLDLNGHTFSELQNGDLTLEPPRAVAALQAMWSSIDPITVAAENGWSSAQLAEYEDMFTAKHITFYVSLGFMASKRAPIRIQHNGQDILFAHQLPSDARPEKRRFEEVDSDDQLEDDFDPPRPEPKHSRKWVPKATPPGTFYGSVGCSGFIGKTEIESTKGFNLSRPLYSFSVR
ncbi:hypothetical protein B0H19DRAFT_1080586 [Mycena capillaripes]|nr:hypothetical protein B0H19DRAFT_1080586 [Mycena capillaripes]